MNLLSNAIKFTSQGSVTFDIKIVNSTENNISINFSVTDTGIGISSENQSKIFEAFSQEDNTTATKFGGTGLGTTIAKSIVELCNSKLEINSELGVGSNFFFIADFEICSSIFEDEDEDEDEDVTHNDCRILIAEDNETNQMIIEMILEDLCIENINILENGLVAFEEYKENHNEYDLILMDINMPVMDGLESTANIIKFEKDNNIKHTPIIALTANTIAGDKEKFLASGLDGYLAKPIKEIAVLEILKEFA